MRISMVVVSPGGQRRKAGWVEEINLVSGQELASILRRRGVTKVEITFDNGTKIEHERGD